MGHEGIPPAQYGAEHARIACARLLDETPDLIIAPAQPATIRKPEAPRHGVNA